MKIQQMEEQYQMMNPIDCSFHDMDLEPFSCEKYSCNAYINANSLIESPMKQVEANSWNSCITENHIPPPPKAYSLSPSPHIIPFDNSNSSPAAISRSRTPLHAKGHVLAERKRREKLSHSFFSLSELIPGLKKTDKASVLGDAVKYLKQLQDRVNVLEKQVANKTMESAIFVRKTQIHADDENFDGQCNNSFPEIEAKVSDKDVLIRIHCKNKKGCISNIINEVEKLHLFVLNTSLLPFGQAALDITIAAQMEAEFSMTVKDLVKSLRLALLKFIK